MKTDVILVSSRGKEMEKALKQAEKVAAYKGLERQSALQLRLLTEEMMGLMRSITGETEGSFWIEDEEGVYSLHLKVENRMNEEQKAEAKRLAKSLLERLDEAKDIRLAESYDRFGHIVWKWRTLVAPPPAEQR